MLQLSSKRNTIYNNFDIFKENYESAIKNGDDKFFEFLLDSVKNITWGEVCFSTAKYKDYDKFAEPISFVLDYKEFNALSLLPPLAGLGAGVGWAYLVSSQLEGSDGLSPSSFVTCPILGLGIGCLNFSSPIKGTEVMKEKTVEIKGYKYYIGDILTEACIELSSKDDKYSSLLSVINTRSWALNPNLSSSLSNKLMAPFLEEDRIAEQERTQREEQERLKAERERLEAELKAEQEKQQEKLKTEYIQKYVDNYAKSNYKLETKEYNAALAIFNIYGLSSDVYNYYSYYYDFDSRFEYLNIEEINKIHPAITGNNPYLYNKDRYYWIDFSVATIRQWFGDSGVFVDITDSHYDDANHVHIHWDNKELTKKFDGKCHYECLLVFEGLYEYELKNGGSKTIPRFKMVEKKYKVNSDILKMAEESWEKEQLKTTKQVI